MRKIFIDCGGYKASSVELFLRVAPDASDYKIYSFEPEPHFQHYYDKFPDVTLIQQCVWIEDGTVTFYSGLGMSGTMMKSKKCGKPKRKILQLPSIDFSKWVASNFNAQDHIIVKMDIEGAEYKVIEKLIKDGTIHYIDILFVDWHVHKLMPEPDDISPAQQHADIIHSLQHINIDVFCWGHLFPNGGNVAWQDMRSDLGNCLPPLNNT